MVTFLVCWQVAVDAPQGVKSSLLRSIQSGSFEKFYVQNAGNSTMKNLLYGLCLFNSVIHERKKYGALGWNIPYEFNDSDLEASFSFACRCLLTVFLHL